MSIGTIMAEGRIEAIEAQVRELQSKLDSCQQDASDNLKALSKLSSALNNPALQFGGEEWTSLPEALVEYVVSRLRQAERERDELVRLLRLQDEPTVCEQHGWRGMPCAFCERDEALRRLDAIRKLVVEMWIEPCDDPPAICESCGGGKELYCAPRDLLAAIDGPAAVEKQKENTA